MDSLKTVNGVSAVRDLYRFLADPVAQTRSTVRNHGSQVRFRIRLPGGFSRSIYHIAEPQTAKTVYMNYRSFTNGGLIPKASQCPEHNALRRGYFRANGDEYQHYLKLFGPHFKRGQINNVAECILQTADAQLALWPTNEPFDAHQALGPVIKNLALRAFFRDDDPKRGIQAADLVERHARTARVSVKNLVRANVGHLWRSALHKDAEAAYGALLNWADSRKGCPVDHDILSTVVNSPTEKGEMPEDQRIAGYAWTMFGAAYDTSVSLLSWLLMFLARNPRVLSAVIDELEGAPTDDVDAVMRLPYLDAVINESLRLVPPAPMQRRLARGPECAALELDRNASILISAWMVNRNPDLYPDAERYDPDRWSSINPTPFEWLTFSAGPRRCLGIWYAYAFMKMFVVRLLEKGVPQMPDGTELAMHYAVTLRPTLGMPLVIKPKGTAPKQADIRGGIFHQLPQL
ncbi:MAG: cytochrome P450 [Pseudomonadota bacterium]